MHGIQNYLLNQVPGKLDPLRLGVVLQVLCHGLALQLATVFVVFKKGREILQDFCIQQMLGGELLGRRPQEGELRGHEI